MFELQLLDLIIIVCCNNRVLISFLCIFGFSRRSLLIGYHRQLVELGFKLFEVIFLEIKSRFELIILISKIFKLLLQCFDFYVFGSFHLVKGILCWICSLGVNNSRYRTLARLPTGPPWGRVKVSTSRSGEHGSLVNQVKVFLDPLDPDHVILHEFITLLNLLERLADH